MNITWAGYACFKIEGSAVTIVTDPYDSSTGLKLSAKKADVVVSSFPNSYHGNTGAVKEKGESMRVITTPGEYEIKDTFIYGIAAAMKPKKDSGNGLVIYRIEIDGLSLVFLGALDTPLQNGHLEHLEKTDILFIPVGGGSYINAESAQELISQISPKIVIPMCYKIPGAKAELDGIDKFYKEMGVKPADVLPRLKISKKDLVSGETIIKILGIE